MSSQLKQLAYVSQETSANTTASLDDILHQARERNKKHNVTGFLLYCEGSFFQVLEGEQGNVDAIYSSIVRDVRHASVTQLLYRNIEQRLFENWSMAFERYDTSSEVPVEGYSNFMRSMFAKSADISGLKKEGLGSDIETMILTMRKNCLGTAA